MTRFWQNMKEDGVVTRLLTAAHSLELYYARSSVTGVDDSIEPHHTVTDPLLHKTNVLYTTVPG